jgi:predicted secreted hydrolase
MRRRALVPAVLSLVVAIVVAACGGPLLANPPAPHPVITPGPSTPARAADPQPVVLPRDDAPHDRLTEWWYDTGHLVDETGGRWGFELVVFRAERGGFPVTWASHLALTDEGGGAFHYAQRAEIGPQVDVAVPGATGFDLAIRGLDPADPSTFTRAPWTMAGAGGKDHLAAMALPAEAQGDGAGTAFGLSLDLAATRPATLHGGDGYVDFGPAGGSYYYSRTSMDATGTITVGGQAVRVNGTAWFDHQWGDFISVGGGGWDWFALNLADGTDLTLSLVRAADGTYPLAYGTLVPASRPARRLGPGDFTVAVTSRWTSPVTGTTYPAAWTIAVPSESLVVTLVPSVPQQELDTRATTGVVYWEGSQVVRATRNGVTLGGEAYVELTGYAAGR